MLNTNTRAMNIFINFYMPIFNAIYTVDRKIWYVFNPRDQKFTIKTYGRELEVTLDNYQEIFSRRYEIAEEWQEWYYEQLNDEVEENARSNGKR